MFIKNRINTIRQGLEMRFGLVRAEDVRIVVSPVEQVLDDGQSYLYLDHRTKSVWNEADLGQPYSRGFLKERFLDHSERLTVNITPEEGWILGQQVAMQYRNYAGETGVRHESSLIEEFPFAELVLRLRAENVPADHAVSAVCQFERHKQDQLPVIRAWEEVAFRQSTTMYVALAGQLTVSAAGRTAFLRAVDLTLTDDGLQHRFNKNLNLSLRVEQRTALLILDY